MCFLFIDSILWEVLQRIFTSLKVLITEIFIDPEFQYFVICRTLSFIYFF